NILRVNRYSVFGYEARNGYRYSVSGIRLSPSLYSQWLQCLTYDEIRTTKDHTGLFNDKRMSFNILFN
ncbi:MAG: hypothetical protein ACE5EE_06020, partial [Fidelibacterota bacterium]